MRTIKFRTFKRGIMDYNPELKLSSYADLNEQIEKFEDRDYILMQYTGMTDTNGTDIYEGDVVSGATKNKISGGIYFHKGEIVSFKDGCFVTLCKDGGYHILSELSGIEIIGNIYEDKELANDTRRS